MISLSGSCYWLAPQSFFLFFLESSLSIFWIHCFSSGDIYIREKYRRKCTSIFFSRFMMHRLSQICLKRLKIRGESENRYHLTCYFYHPSNKILRSNTFLTSFFSVNLIVVIKILFFYGYATFLKWFCIFKNFILTFENMISLPLCTLWVKNWESEILLLLLSLFSRVRLCATP